MTYNILILFDILFEITKAIPSGGVAAAKPPCRRYLVFTQHPYYEYHHGGQAGTPQKAGTVVKVS